MILIESVDDAETVEVADPANVALTTQTTLSIDDTTEIVDVLKRRFPALLGPKSSDICYATQNRQDAVREVVAGGRRPGAGGRVAQLLQLEPHGRGGAGDRGAEAHLIDNVAELDPAWLDGQAPRRPHRRRVGARGAGAAGGRGASPPPAISRGGEEIPSAEGVFFALPREASAPTR